MVDGDMYECVKSYCYLGHTHDGAATARVRNGWIKLRDRLPFLTSGAPRWRCRVECMPVVSEA